MDKDGWDLCVTLSIGIGLVIFRKHRNQFFNAASDIDVVRRSFNTGRDWECSFYLARIGKHTRSAYSLRELVNCTAITPSKTLRLSIRGINKILSNSMGLIKVRNILTPHLSYLVRTSNKISELINGNSTSSQLNEIFSSMSNSRVSFPMIF